MSGELPEESLAEIELEDRGSKGRYVLRSPAGDEAEMTFTKIGEHQIIIDHTEVPDAFRGQGAGPVWSPAPSRMRAPPARRSFRCPFAAAQFRRHREWHDVLKK